MKNQGIEMPGNQVSQSWISDSDSSNELCINPKEIKIKCCNREALDMCINENCSKQTIFICGVPKCKCHKEHGFCPKVNLKNIVDSIQLKVLPDQEIKNFIELKIESIINELSKLRQELFSQVHTKMKYSGLHQIEKEFLEHAYAQEEKKKKINTKDSVLLWRLASIKSQKSFLYDVNGFLNKFQKESLKNIQSFKKQFDELFQHEKNKKQIYLTKMKQKFIKTLNGQSSIVKSSEDAIRLLQFFPAPLKRITLLYKASDYQFNIAKFYETCGSTSNIVILCQSNKGKIVGGYTPLYFYLENQFTSNSRYNQVSSPKSITDSSGKSFMFSLTNNDKFSCQLTSEAIYRTSDRSYICFGREQILIHDKANSNNQCQLRCNYAYKNEQYKVDDKDSYIKLSGNQTPKCALNQWQVWKVEM